MIDFLVLVSVGLFILTAMYLLFCILVIFSFHFPRKCEKCGKFRAFVLTRVDRTNYYTAGGFIVSNHCYARKICIKCGHKSKEWLKSKNEVFIKH